MASCRSRMSGEQGMSKGYSGTLGLCIVCFKGTRVAGTGAEFPGARINYKGFIDPLHSTPWHNGK